MTNDHVCFFLKLTLLVYIQEHEQFQSCPTGSVLDLQLWIEHLIYLYLQKGLFWSILTVGSFQKTKLAVTEEVQWIILNWFIVTGHIYKARIPLFCHGNKYVAWQTSHHCLHAVICNRKKWLNRSALRFEFGIPKTENTSFFIIWGDSKLLICPLGCIRPRKVTLQQDKEPLRCRYKNLPWWFIQVQEGSYERYIKRLHYPCM